MKKICFLILVSIFLGTGISKAQYKDLYDFDGINGAYPNGGLVLSGNALYGMASQGGINSKGAIFSINTDGTGYKDLLDFNGTNGASPYGSLALSQGVLYGMTFAGGPADGGLIFSINTDGSGYKNLMEFNGTNGYAPYGSLLVYGNVLYGMTSGYNVNQKVSNGNIFSINTDGSGFTNLHNFDGSDGQNPHGDLSISGNVLYGMTRGANIFSINIDGTKFNNLYVFNSSLITDLSGSLMISGNVLFGSSFTGGPLANDNGNDGFIFSINTDGTGYKDLYDFNVVDGKKPIGRLTLLGNILYGTTYYGGANSGGVLFSINTDGSGYKNMFSFNSSKGYYPCGYLTLVNDFLFGMTSSGGGNGSGVAFSYNTSLTTGSIEINSSNVDMAIFPNPANTFFTISYQENYLSNIVFNTTDVNGRLIYTDKQYKFSGQYNKTIDLSDEPKGMYFVEMFRDGQKQSKKIILQ